MGWRAAASAAVPALGDWRACHRMKGSMHPSDSQPPCRLAVAPGHQVVVQLAGDDIWVHCLILHHRWGVAARIDEHCCKSSSLHKNGPVSAGARRTSGGTGSGSTGGSGATSPPALDHFPWPCGRRLALLPLYGCPPGPCSVARLRSRQGTSHNRRLTGCRRFAARSGKKRACRLHNSPPADVPFGEVRFTAPAKMNRVI